MIKISINKSKDRKLDVEVNLAELVAVITVVNLFSFCWYLARNGSAMTAGWNAGVIFIFLIVAVAAAMAARAGRLEREKHGR